MKRLTKILASVIAGLMLATTLAGCDFEQVKNYFPFLGTESEVPTDEEEPNDEPGDGETENETGDEPSEPVFRTVLDFDNQTAWNSWVFYNMAHTGEKDVCGEIVQDETGNKQIKIRGEGNNWEGVEFDTPQGLGITAKKIVVTVTSSKAIAGLKFSLEYEKNYFIEATVDIPVGTNEIELEFEQEFSMIYSFSVKTSRALYQEIYLDNIRAIENKTN